MTGGVLNVAGTAGADSIALRYDPYSAQVHVVDGDNELIGQYPLSAVQSLNVDGGAGDDRFEVDAQLPLAINLHGGEGEDLFAALAPVGHVHGAADAPPLAQSSIERTEQFSAAAAATPLVASGPSAGPVLGSSLLENSSATSIFSSASSLPLATTNPASADHSLHSPAALPTDLHSYHPLGLATASNSLTGTSATLAGATYFTAAIAQNDWTPASSTAGRIQISDHHARGGAGPSAEVVAKLAPKRCTVRFTSKEVARTVTGDRKCNCAQMKAAAAAAAHAAESEQATNNGRTDAQQAETPVACPRCQRALLEWDLALTAEACPLPLPALNVETPRSAAEPAAPSDSSCQNEAYLATYTLAGLSLIALQSVSQHRRRALADDGFIFSADWLFSRLSLERLAS